MSYLVLARKWRPQTFRDLVGQEHVSRTLANAIQTNRVAHAFLFTGVRGVGKTTSARIMAKALNCERGPTAEPCLACPPCREIAAGSDVDVQEIDGASYNGVDEVRKLQESLPYRPARDRYKIIIVDEVHMLSSNAWNAFLKTLEEPPPHVKFIFATTEVHKVPVTILSRCQRYDFKLIPTQIIGKRLRYVLDEEKIAADDAAIALVAREAAGSMRDGMSLLDQAIAWGGDKLVGEEVARVLGVAARSVLHRISQALLAGDAAACLAVVSELAEGGYDMTQVARGLLAELRDLVVAKVCKEPGHLLDLADEEAREVRALAESGDADDLVRLHHGFSQAYDDVVRSVQPRAALEMLLVRLARRPPLAPIDDLVQRLLELEKRLATGGAAPTGPARPAPGSPGAAPPRTANRGPSAPSAGPGAGPTGGAGPSGAPPATASASPPFAAPFTPPSALASVAPAPTPFARPTSARPAEPSHGAPPPSSSSSSSLSSSLSSSSHSSSSPPPFARPTSGVTAGPMRASAGPSRGPFAAAAELAGAEPAAPLPRPEPSSRQPNLDAWRAVLERIRIDRASLAAVLEHASPIAFGADRVVLGYEAGSFLAAQATETSAVELLTQKVRAHFGALTPVAFDLTAGPRSSPSIAALDGNERRARLDRARRDVAEHPLVRAAIEILSADLREVRIQNE